MYFNVFFFHHVLLDLFESSNMKCKTNLQSAVPSNEDDDRQAFINSHFFFAYLVLFL